MTTKFSQFTAGGLIRISDIPVGLRGGINIQLTAGGIADTAGNKILTYSQVGSGTAVNYIDIVNAAITGAPLIQALGTDLNVNLTLQGKGARGYVQALGTGAFIIPSGTLGEQPVGIAGMIRNNSTDGFLYYYDGVAAAWESVAPLSGVITAVNGTANQIDASTVAGIATLSLDSSLILPGTLTTSNQVTLSGLTANGVLGLNGSSNVASTVLGAGQILIGTTASAAAAAAIGSGTGILVQNGSGTISIGLASIATLNLLANLTGGSAAPTAHTLSAIIDGCIGSTQGDILYRNSTSWTVLTPGTSGYVLTTGGPAANPSWTATAGGGAALTKSDDTNVTLTLGGSPTTALLAATSITAGWTGQLAVGRGGSGNSTFTAYSVLCAGTTATGAFQNVSGVGTAGQVLTSNGAAALPTWQAAGGGGGVTSVATGIGLQGGPITTTGTINLSTTSANGYRLTLTSNTPVTTSDVTAATTIFLTPYQGYDIDVYSGSSNIWTRIQPGQLSISVPATTSTNYDIFINASAGGTLVAVAWTNATTRATTLIYQNGILVENGTLTNRYLGSFATTGVSGQTEDSILNRLLFNYYNRTTRSMARFESTTSWTYTTAAWRQANGSASNQLNFLVGIVEESYFANVGACANNTSIVIVVNAGIGLNSTTSPLGATASIISAPTTSGLNGVIFLYATSITYPTLGLNYLAWLEYGGSSGTTTWYSNGGQANASSGISAQIRM